MVIGAHHFQPLAPTESARPISIASVAKVVGFLAAPSRVADFAVSEPFTFSILAT